MINSSVLDIWVKLMLKLTIFSVISLLLVISIMCVIKRFEKNEKRLDLYFIISSILTVLIHYSVPIIKFRNGDYFIEDNLFLPVYPCNVMMWVNLVLCFLIIKKGKAFKILATFSMYVGTVCGIIGLCFNANFLNTPYFSDYSVLKGLLSHVTLIFSSLFIGLFGYIKIDTIKNLTPLLIGAVILILCSIISDKILVLMGRQAINGMFLKPAEDYRFASFYTISLAGLVLYFIFTSIYEGLRYKEEAWFRRIGNKEENERDFN